MNIFYVPEEARKIYEELLPEDLLQDEPVLVAAGEMDGDRGVDVSGIAAFSYIGEGAWELSFIHVISDMRDKGLGKTMIGVGANILRSVGCDTIFCSYRLDEDSEALDKCLRKAYFKPDEVGAVECGTIKDFAAGVEKYDAGNKEYNVSPLSSLSVEEWDRVVSTVLGENERMPEEDVYLDISGKDSYEQDISLVIKGVEGKVKGVILFSETEEEKVISLNYIWAKRSAGVIFAGLMNSALNSLQAKYTADTKVIFHAKNPVAGRLAEKLLGEKKRKQDDVVLMVRHLV